MILAGSNDLACRAQHRGIGSLDLLSVNETYRRSTMQKITPFLWFNDKAEEAMNFYVSIFKNSKVGRVTRYGDAGPGFTFTPAVSFFVNCETQQEVDEL